MFNTGLGDLLQQAKKVREDVQNLQHSLAAKTIEASSGGGMVRVQINGKQEILSVEIDSSLIQRADKKMIEDLVRSSVNQAIQNAQAMVSDEMSKITGGMGPLLSFLKGMG